MSSLKEKILDAIEFYENKFETKDEIKNAIQSEFEEDNIEFDESIFEDIYNKKQKRKTLENSKYEEFYSIDNLASIMKNKTQDEEEKTHIEHDRIILNERLKPENLQKLIIESTEQFNFQPVDLKQNSKIDKLLNETKEKLNKPNNHKYIKKGTESILKKVNIDTLFSNDLSDEDKNKKQKLQLQISNYVDMFSDHPSIITICGSDLSEFKASLYGYDIKTLEYILQEIQCRLNSGCYDFENFLNLISSASKISELLSDLLLGIKISGLNESILDEIDEHSLKMLSCQLSVSRYITPQSKIMIIFLKKLISSILSSESFKNSTNFSLKDKLSKMFGLAKLMMK